MGHQPFRAAEQGGATGGQWHLVGKTHTSLAPNRGSHALRGAGSRRRYAVESERQAWRGLLETSGGGKQGWGSESAARGSGR